jgi:hypothetical protein
VTAPVTGFDQLLQPFIANGADAEEASLDSASCTTLSAASPSPCRKADATYVPAGSPVTCCDTVIEYADPE